MGMVCVLKLSFLSAIAKMKAKIYPVKLGTFKDVDYAHMFINTRFGEKLDTACSSFIIIDGDNIIVFDTGHKQAHFNKGDVVNLIGNAEENYKKKFDELNIKFTDVTHIVLSHLHFDHVQNCDLFPNAKIYIQRKEMAYAAAPIYPLYIESADIAYLIGNCSDRIVYLDGEDNDEIISPNVRLVLLGGHTVGSQVAFVETSRGCVALTGDIVNAYENMEVRSVKEIDVIAWVKAIKRIKKEADIILPQHEMRVFDDYPSIE